MTQMTAFNVLVSTVPVVFARSFYIYLQYLPLGRPLHLPRQFGITSKRRESPRLTTALRPFYFVGATHKGDRFAVEVR